MASCRDCLGAVEPMIEARPERTVSGRCEAKSRRWEYRVRGESKSTPRKSAHEVLPQGWKCIEHLDFGNNRVVRGGYRKQVILVSENLLKLAIAAFEYALKRYCVQRSFQEIAMEYVFEITADLLSIA